MVHVMSVRGASAQLERLKCCLKSCVLLTTASWAGTLLVLLYALHNSPQGANKATNSACECKHVAQWSAMRGASAVCVESFHICKTCTTTYVGRYKREEGVRHVAWLR